MCRVPVLVCYHCRSDSLEYHCRQHAHLSAIYFTVLERFDINSLQNQYAGLVHLFNQIKLGKQNKNKRKTISKQIERVLSMIAMRSTAVSSEAEAIDLSLKLANPKERTEEWCTWAVGKHTYNLDDDLRK